MRTVLRSQRGRFGCGRKSRCDLCGSSRRYARKMTPSFSIDAHPRILPRPLGEGRGEGCDFPLAIRVLPSALRLHSPAIHPPSSILHPRFPSRGPSVIDRPPLTRPARAPYIALSRFSTYFPDFVQNFIYLLYTRNAHLSIPFRLPVDACFPPRCLACPCVLPAVMLERLDFHRFR